MAKVLISLEDGLLKRIDDEAQRRRMSRSALMGEMAAKELGLPMGPGADPEVQAAILDLQELFREARYADARDSTAIVRDMRDSR